jgi:hypothetical protein
MMTMPAGGVGRGLSTILTGATTAPAPRGSTTDHLIERALTAMAPRGPLRVCGYLDDPFGSADLTLRSPDLGSLHPTEAYQLFSALSSVDADVPGRHDLDVGSHRAMAVVVEAGGGRGLWFFGDDRLDDTSIERLAQLAEAHGPAVCDHRPAGADADPIAVDLDRSDTGWSARVRWSDAEDPVEGRGIGARPVDAAAAAVVDASGFGPVHVEVDVIAAENGDAVVTILGLGPIMVVGAADAEFSGDDAALAVAAATAARRAARRLTPG